jgi:SAM-dependent methyltransferase
MSSASESQVSPLAASNVAAWTNGSFVAEYSRRELRPVEVLLMVRYRDHFAGRVLELGCGAGRITGYLAALAREVHALDVSPVMVRECRRRCPTAHVELGDARDLSAFEEESLDLVVAGCNLLDVFSDRERREVLRSIRRLLVPGGLLIMSSHNRAYLPRVRRPWQVGLREAMHGDLRAAARCARDIAWAPVRIRRHLRLRGLEQDTPAYAIVSDGAHRFKLVHYFTWHEDQRRQFAEEGFEPLLAADLGGRQLSSSYMAPDCPEIHYVARNSALA